MRTISVRVCACAFAVSKTFISNIFHFIIIIILPFEQNSHNQQKTTKRRKIDHTLNDLYMDQFNWEQLRFSSVKLLRFSSRWVRCAKGVKIEYHDRIKNELHAINEKYHSILCYNKNTCAWKSRHSLIWILTLSPYARDCARASVCCTPLMVLHVNCWYPNFFFLPLLATVQLLSILKIPKTPI